ncbi:SDR family NAD(P)-dependent oxidoreductase [Comamonas guangdongensis]|uniref:SDR family NAD(P)-dependent oxidoreductase n=1 Tax=Comamonas guangdongensis TaxID=510515 RepID=A0ABV3ZVL0_9BURK
MTSSFSPLDGLDGQIAVITGGAGAIGAATARRLAALGARVVLLHRGPADKAAPLLQSLAGQGHGAVSASVTDSAQLATAAETVARNFGATSILVNCAGHTRPVPAGDLQALSDELIDEMFASNWRGTFAAIRAFAPQLQAGGDGLIVNVSSIAGMTGLGSNLAYAAAKAGIDALTKGLAKTLAPKVRVLAVSPGVVDSGFVAGRDASFNARTGATIPLQRVGNPDDVAAAIQACCTGLRYATGSIFVADGGRHL